MRPIYRGRVDPCVNDGGRVFFTLTLTSCAGDCENGAAPEKCNAGPSRRVHFRGDEERMMYIVLSDWLAKNKENA